MEQRPRNGDPPDGDELVQMELQPDAEEEQDDADLGELIRHVLIGDVAARERPDRDTGDQVAHDR